MMSSIRGKRRERMFKQDEERERLYYRLRRWDNSNPNVELNEKHTDKYEYQIDERHNREIPLFDEEQQNPKR